MKKDVLIFVATGFEDTELITSINIFSREKISYDLVSIENLEKVQAQKEAIVKTVKLKNIDISEYRSIFLPGGQGYKLMLENKKVMKIIKTFEKKPIFAICAAPIVLLKAGVVKNNFTSFPGMAKDYRNTGNAIEIDTNIITARDFLVTPKFAFEVVKRIKEIKN